VRGPGRTQEWETRERTALSSLRVHRVRTWPFTGLLTGLVTGLLGVLLALVGLTSNGGATSAAATPQKTGAAGQLQQALDRLVATRGGPPGAIVVVQRGGTQNVYTAGVAEVGQPAAPQGTDHVRIASVSKAFSGAAALALVADDRLTLNTTIGEVLPTLPAAWHRVTLAELLQHTSGVPDYSASKAFQKALGESLTVAPPPEELLGYVAKEPLEFRPGSRYAYSNSDNVIVALMVQALAGAPYATALQQEVTQPLGLGQTTLPTGASLPPAFLHGYDVDPEKAPEDVSEAVAAGWSYASGGIVSTPLDVDRFIRGYVSGALTDGATRARQFAFRAGNSEPPGPGTNAVGLALFRYTTSCGVVYGHTGNTLGYTAFTAASRDGTRSLSVTVSAQITPKVNGALFDQLRQVFGRAVCAALAR
jgi:D-alanyl-D-alanine carboxypeptidase